MKKRIYTAFLCLTVFLAAHAQEKIDPRIQEVYGDQTQEQVLNDAERLKFLTNILQNRVKIIEVAIDPEDKFIKLSQVGLLNKYNPDLTREVVFDPLNFNILKYDLNFFSKTDPIFYRVDNSNYLIVIEPQLLK